MALRVLCFITVAFTFVHLTPLLEEEYHFKQWMSQHNRVYDVEEYHYRLHVFTQNKRMIDHHNAGNHSFTMGLNQFSDMTFQEFRKFYLFTQPQNCSVTKTSHVSSTGPHPESVDWRTKGNFVTHVKDQGYCGSCWTFSTTGCLESVNAIATGKLIPLSEQQLLDCSKHFHNYGCLGGLPSQAFEYIKYNKGLMTEEDYPYKAHDDTCNFNPKLAAAFIQDVVNITSYDEKAMVDAVARLNPITFSFDATAEFMHYKEGVFSSTQCKNTTDRVNHAVLAVGYGTDDNDTPYWIVKNSWGTGWGKDGYFLIERGTNMCGLAACSSYPLPLVRGRDMTTKG
ncbi:pro-cathepsin H-like [Mugil cephalus]|uniref:pro-cathepsin H-like n=1 Tax=Mugil cephalus TaxID=48193 RepID=UPI001FB73335|nr:pro-cathepsin H-like [Mugil cephalus]